MSFYVRKITKGKWSYADCELMDTPGDAVTDLKTSGNALSVWKIDSVEEEEINKAIMALATSSRIQNIETIDIVYISEEVLVQHGLVMDDTQLGDTAITALGGLHRNVTGVTYSVLGEVTSMIRSLVETQHKRVTGPKLKKMLKKEFDQGHIDTKKCHEKLLLCLEKIT